MLPFSLIASDLDGTIIGHNNQVSQRTVDAFAAWAGAGGNIVFVTGRPIRWLDPLRAYFAHQGSVICSNGALIYDLGSDDIVEVTPIAPELIREARGRILERFPDTLFAIEAVDSTAFYVDQGFTSDKEFLARNIPTVGSEPALDSAERMVKFLARNWEVEIDEFLKITLDLVSDLLTPTVSSPDMPLVEMGPPGVDKATTLARYCAQLNIAASEVVAFGDMPNDIPMLNWAGRSYAVASGHPGAIAATDFTAPAFGDDGVAQVIEKLLAGTS